MKINADRLERQIKAMDELCPHPGTSQDWVIWRIGFRHGSIGHVISRNGSPTYRDGYKSGDDWAKANQPH